MKPGQRLYNGAVVIAASKSIVLATWRNEFVTWSINALGATCNGNYFADSIAAMRDFTRRVGTV